jgi:hypothetical protein
MTSMDQRPGSVPEIRATDRGLTFPMAPAGFPSGDLVILRCDADGEIWLSIEDRPRPIGGRRAGTCQATSQSASI